MRVCVSVSIRDEQRELYFDCIERKGVGALCKIIDGLLHEIMEQVPESVKNEMSMYHTSFHFRLIPTRWTLAGERTAFRKDVPNLDE